MATSSNGLAMAKVSTCRSCKSPQEDIEELGIKGEIGYEVHNEDELSTMEELDTEGENGYEVRNKDELSIVEQLCLKTLDDDLAVQKIITSDSVILFKGPKTLLETWPFFFSSKEESGIEMQQGLVILWSNFLIAETLLAAISIQPLVMVPNIAHGWKFKLYKFIWMISMIFDLWGIAITALFLGYLLGCPNKVAWKWMCEIGWLSRIPSILVILDTMLTLLATTYTCWILYGYQMGIVCAIVEVFYVVSGFKLATILSSTIDEVTNCMQ